jgi:hypothetical protein
MARTETSRGMRALLLSARIGGGLFVAMLAFVIVVNFVIPNDEPVPQGTEWLGLAMFPLGVFVAYVLAFRFRLAGGALAIACLLGWWVHVGFDPDILGVAAVVAVPGILYVTHALLSRRRPRTA